MEGTVPQEKKLLITSCTRRKNDSQEKMTAWDRYEGGCFPLLKRLQRTCDLFVSVDILILSAKYGLLLPTDQIEFYDQCMTSERAFELLPVVTHKLSSILAQTPYIQTFVLLEPTYLLCLSDCTLPNIHYHSSFSEEHLASLEHWLLAELP